MRNKKEHKRRVVLTSKELSELFIEAVITIILLIIVNIAILMITSSIINSTPALNEAIFESRTSFVRNFNSDIFLSGRNILIPVMLVLDVLFLYWRLIRRYRQMQQRHIISELHYIANGHYDHRIPFELRGDLARLVDSINGLVDSTVMAIEEERRIEKSKDELITNVSHDIRTPLTSIIGYLGLIEDQQYHSEEELLKYTHTAFIK